MATEAVIAEPPPAVEAPAARIKRIRAIGDRRAAEAFLREVGLTRREASALIARVKAALVPTPPAPEKGPESDMSKLSKLLQRNIDAMNTLTSPTGTWHE